MSIVDSLCTPVLQWAYMKKQQLRVNIKRSEFQSIFRSTPATLEITKAALKFTSLKTENHKKADVQLMFSWFRFDIAVTSKKEPKPFFITTHTKKYYFGVIVPSLFLYFSFLTYVNNWTATPSTFMFSLLLFVYLFVMFVPNLVTILRVKKALQAAGYKVPTGF